MKKLLTLVLAMVFAVLSFAAVSAQELSGADLLNRRIRYPEEFKERMLEREAHFIEREERRASAAAGFNGREDLQQWRTERFADSNWRGSLCREDSNWPGFENRRRADRDRAEGWQRGGGLCWDEDGNWAGYENCPRELGFRDGAFRGGRVDRAESCRRR